MMPVQQKVTTAIICDDEPAMRAQLRASLHNAWPDLHIIAEATNGHEAVELVNLHNPDIIFLDIRMPGQSGMEVAQLVYKKTHIAFITAYDQYAIQAFDQGAIDYLLKPVDAERLALTCERLRSRVNENPEDITTLLARLLDRSENNKPKYLRWVQASVGNSVRMISTQDILFFQADEKYTRVQLANAQVLIRKPLKELVDELDPNEFWRIHRSTLVQVNAIVEVTRDISGRQKVQLRNYPQLLEVSRSYSHLFQQM